MDIIENELIITKQRNVIELLEQQREELRLDIEMNKKMNKLSLEERVKVKLETDELKKKIEKIDKRLEKLESKK